MRKIFYILLIGFILLASSPASATWVRERGRALFYLDTSVRIAYEYFSGGRRETPEHIESSTSIYADYGVTSIYTIGLYFPFLKFLTIDSTDISPRVRHLNIGDIDLIQRLQVFSIAGAVFNLELLVSVPIGDDTPPTGLFTGDGELNFMPGFSIGWGFNLFSLPSYLTFQSGVNLRTEEFSHEVHVGFQWGLFVYKKYILLHVEIKRLQSLRTEPEDTVRNGLWNNTRYTSYGVGVTYKPLSDIGISFYYKTVGQVENAIGGNIFSLAFFYLL